MGGIAILLSIMAGIGSLLLSAKSNNVNERIATRQNELAEQTLEWNKSSDTQTFEYNKWLNEMQMQREDTAVQRRMADLQAAGLSPLLAAGDSATSGAGGTLSRNQISAPDLQGVDYSNGFNSILNNFNNAYSSALQGYNTYIDTQKANADISLIKSQTDKNQAEFLNQVTANRFQEQKLMNDQALSYITIQQKLHDIDMQLAKLEGQEQSNEYQRLKNEQQVYINMEEYYRKMILEHDYEIYKNIQLPTSIVDKGGQTIYGQGYTDSVLVNGLNPTPASSVYTGTPEETNNLIKTGNTEFDSAINKGSGATGEPFIKVEPNSITVGNYKDKGEIDGSYISAGNGYKTFNSGDTYYGGYPVKQSNLNDFLKAIQSGATKIPMSWLVINRAK